MVYPIEPRIARIEGDAAVQFEYLIAGRSQTFVVTRQALEDHAFSKNAGLNFDTSAINFANGYFLASGQSTMLGAALGIRHKF